MRLVRACLLGATIIWVGAGSFFAARWAWDSVIAEADDPLPAKLQTINADFQLPRFNGEILGVFIAPRDAPVPDKYITFAEHCGSERATTEQLPWEDAGQFALTVDLPGQFTFEPDSLNSGVVGCAGKAYAARWNYAAREYNDYQGNLVVARGVFSHFPFDVSVGRVKAIVAGGRPAVLMEPITPDGIGSNAAVIFPEPFGATEIQSSGISTALLLEVAERVGNATR